tara:strand:+ start:3406 stop:4122 length:717 start_codon:yes stop_codon:yes gene_type:complete
MSLIATASPWNSSDSTKKRIPTMRKTMKKIPSLEKDLENSREDENSFERPTSFEEDQTVNNDRSERVNKLLDNMSSVLEENDGNKLADFNPIPLPNIQKKTDSEIPPSSRTGDEDLSIIPNHLQLQPPKIEKESSNFGPSGIDLGNPQQPNVYGNYHRIYKPTNMRAPMQYGNNIVQPNLNITDNKLLEKVNYMIYMLEQQQNEKTSNITEEFVLYTFLGVFIIFIVDSFTRSGKYIR